MSKTLKFIIELMILIACVWVIIFAMLYEGNVQTWLRLALSISAVIVIFADAIYVIGVTK